MADGRSLEITSGNAAKIAADLVQVAYGPELTGAGPESVLEAWSALHLTVTQRLIDNTAQIVAGNLVASAFPGTSPVPTPAQPVDQGRITIEGTPFPTQPAIVAPPAVAAPAVPQAPGNVIPFPAAQPVTQAPIPGAAPANVDPKIDEAVQQFVQDCQAGTMQQNWDDNRAAKAADPSKKFPDFKHKSWKRPGEKYEVGFYLNDKKMSAQAKALLASVGL